MSAHPRSHVSSLLMLLLVLACTAPGLAGGTVRFRPAATVHGTIVTLGDVAEIAAADAERAARLRAVQLGPSPLPGETLRLEFRIVRSRLQAHGFNLAELEFAGHSVVEVHRDDRASATGTVDAPAGPPPWKRERAERLVADAIREHCERLAPELGVVQVAVELQPDHVDQVLAASHETIRVTDPAVAAGKAQPLTLRIGDPGRGADIEVSASVTPLPWVLAVNADLPTGHRVRVEDLAWAQAETADGLFTEVERLVGHETGRPVRAGQPVQADDVRSVPLIRSGDIVTVSSRRAGISVRRAMKARDDGGLGEVITVTTLDGRERLTARVTGFHEAEVGPQLQPTGPAAAPAGLRVVTETQPANRPAPSTTVAPLPGTP